MMQTICEKTAACGDSQTVAAQSGPSKLLQIHPVEINKGLIALGHKAFLIGRDHCCQLQLDDHAVSRQHLRIEWRADNHVVFDLGSTNGTFVNEESVSEKNIAPGDRIRVGKHIFKLLSSDEIESQYYEAVYGMMTQDGLTGTINKRAFLDILKRETRRCLNTDRLLSLIMFDIDHFKKINDTHGHLAGDQVLQETTIRISEVLESHVVFARYGGEEFSILVPEMDAPEAYMVAERCRKAVCRAPFETTAGPIPLTISLGVADLASINPNSLAPDQDLIAAADHMLYAAKHQGRNRVGV